jgi:hypothetical protein
MTEPEILSAMTGILPDLLLDDLIVPTMESRRDDVHGWGSFNYIYCRRRSQVSREIQGNRRRVIR